MYWATFDKKPYSHSPPLSKLSLTEIGNLDLGQVHYGYYLKMKVASQCIKLVGIQVTCQDHMGTSILVSIYNFNSKNRPLNQIFTKGKIIYLKEPFYKIANDGNFNIRIDNPNDIVFENDPEAKQLTKDLEQKDSTQQEQYFRLEGLRLMKNKNYIEAYILYCQALNQTNSVQYTSKFLLNKAIVSQKLNLLQEYLTTVMEVLKINPKNSKAIYHQIKALLFNDKQEKAMKILKQNQQGFDKETILNIHKMLKLIKQGKQGKIDWYRALKYNEIGVYSSPDIKFKKGQNGKGLFAVKNMKPGTLLWVERIVMINELKKQALYDLQACQTNTNRAIYRLMELSEQFHKKVMIFREQIKERYLQDLAQGKYESEDEMIYVMNCQQFRDFQHKWFFLQSFGDYLEVDKSKTVQVQKMGLVQKLSLVNHSCEKNTQKFCIDDKIVLLTTKQIKAGEQIFISYYYNQMTLYPQRMKELDHLKIDCGCQLCLEQDYEMRKGKIHPHPKSEELIKLRLFQKLGKAINERSKKELFAYHDLTSISMMLQKGKDLKLAVQMLQRILPMTEEETIEILEKYTSK